MKSTVIRGYVGSDLIFTFCGGVSRWPAKAYVDTPGGAIRLEIYETDVDSAEWREALSTASNRDIDIVIESDDGVCCRTWSQLPPEGEKFTDWVYNSLFSFIDEIKLEVGKEVHKWEAGENLFRFLTQEGLLRAGIVEQVGPNFYFDKIPLELNTELGLRYLVGNAHVKEVV